ncbi:PAS domain-containing sensor histidine kinase [Crateriforma conspicua]|uniref:PAS domain-containing sensor histidine kinase n=1 Tax=Crateriforma conspicua TaxID=2527996 RepID=UPI00118C7C35|nr:PAS domain S-box protein [Crateriforma conspicua]QDV64112.1 Phytochrome-like protein cph1 [Crateriforma conspicua]
MQSLREYLNAAPDLVYQALDLATAGFYVCPISDPSGAGQAREARSADANSCGRLTDVFFSKRAFASLGRPIPDNDLWQTWVSLIHPEDRQRVVDEIKHAMNQTSATVLIEYRLLRDDGSYRFTRESGKTVRPDQLGRTCYLGVLSDIDRQVEFERRLIRQNHDTQTILDTIPTCIWVKDEHSRIERINRAAAEGTGLPPEQIVGKLTRDVYPTEAKRFEETDATIMQGDMVRAVPEKLVHRDGSFRNMLIDKYKLQCDADSRARILVVGSDVTELVSTQRAMAKSEALFRTMFDSSPIGMLLVGNDGMIRLANERCQAMFGYQDGDLINHSIEQLVPLSSRGAHRRHRDTFSSVPEGRRRGDVRHLPAVRKDGSKFVVDVWLTNVSVDNQVMTLASVSDVTEQANTETRLKLAVEVGNVGFWETDPNTGRVELSPQALRQMGITEPITDVQGFLDRLHPDDREATLKAFDDHVRGDLPIYEAVFRLLHVDGDYRWVISRGICIRDDDGVAQPAVGFHIDITEQQEMKLELERSNQDLDRFAYIASHDLKAPLRGIQNIVGWLKEDLDDQADPDIDDHLRLLTTQADRMNRLLDDLLQYARIGRESVAVQDVDLAKTVPELFQFISPPPHIRLEIPGDLPTFQTARAPLEQVIRNLFTNAVQHAGSQNDRIAFDCRRDGEFYCFRVRDWGKGVPAEYHEKVFQLFQSITPRDRQSGTGLGLALVRRLVEQAGGRAWVESPQDGGAAFGFTWPVKYRV